MKTPREFLLDRHRETEPALDAVRRNALRLALNPDRTGYARRASSAPPHATAASPRLNLRDYAVALGSTLRRELLVPCRYAWLSLAGLWLLVFLLTQASEGSRGLAADGTRIDAARFEAGLRERQQLNAELLELGSLRDSPAGESSAGPRSAIPCGDRFCQRVRDGSAPAWS